MKIYLVRHSHYIPDKDSSDGSLSKLGKQQAEKIGERFLYEKIIFNEIYSSISIRAKQTADICCKKLGIENFLYNEDLCEADKYEEPIDVLNRINDFIDNLKLKHNKGNFCLFSHCYIIRYLLRKLTNNANLSVLPHAGIALLDYKNDLKIADYSPLKHLEGILSY